MPKESKTIGISLPDDFDVDRYDKINQQISSQSHLNNPTWSHFAAAWGAVGYRYRALSDHDGLFGVYITKNDTAESIYIQERELFSFFVSGIAVFDSFSYALFAAGSMLNQKNFPIMTDSNQRDITPKKVSNTYKSHYPSETITSLLNSLVISPKFKNLHEVRNKLAHRIAANARIIYLSADKTKPAPPDEWKMHPGFILDANATHSWRLWIADWLNKLLEATDQFAQNHFP